MTKTKNTLWLSLGWSAVVLLIGTLIAFSTLRTIETYGGEPPTSTFASRYVENPITTAVHMLTGMAFVILAPFQFIAGIRNRHRQFHRIAGRFLVGSALFAGVYGLIATTRFPAFGGFVTFSAGWFYGPIFIFGLLRGFWHIRNRRIQQHREWMIRVFALGLGVGTQRIMIAILSFGVGIPFAEVFGPALWIGFTLNLLIAEIWINHTRVRTTTKRPGN